MGCKNRNVMVNNKDFRHITVTGFIGDNNGTPAKKKRAGQGKQQVTQKKVSSAKKDLNDSFDLAVKAFKEEASKKIGQTESKILELRNKITDTSKVLAQIYQDDIDRLEYNKKKLINKLDEYKDLGADDWKKFKHQFNDEIENIETSIANFLENFKLKKKQEDKTSE